MRTCLRALHLAGAVLLASAGAVWAEDAYRLGPLDQLQVKVSDLRAGTGEAYQWQAFNGEFTVGASGRVSLPVVGEIEASGRTTSDIAADIADRLKTKAGLATKPDASVQIIKFRPFYVTGSVEKPGGYEYRPNLTVLQGVSLAGASSGCPPTSCCNSCVMPSSRGGDQAARRDPSRPDREAGPARRRDQGCAPHLPA
ncbi:polysaccharide biosynthesis/export family protein [Methylobacterium persicinum]